MRRRFFYFFLFLALFGASLGLVSFAMAQGLDVGTNAVNNTIALSSTDPRVIAGRVINILLLFLGAIAVSLIIYAGFIWMTSNGNEDKIEQAKKILKNAIIGLVIILASWGIASFILSRLLGATGGNSSNGGDQNNSALIGTGAIGACTVERVYPEDGQTDVARNTSLMVTFKEAVNLTSVCQNASGTACACNATDCRLINPKNIRIFRQDIGDNCSDSSCPDNNTNVYNAYVQASADRHTLIIVPIDFLGSPDGNIDYSVKMTSGLVKDDGKSIFKTCNTDYLQWSFQVSNKLDLTPPQVSKGKIFPFPDNAEDITGQSQPAVAATASIKVNSCPNIYQPAAILSVTPTAGGRSATATIDSDYHADFTLLSVVSTVDNTQAQLFHNQDLLGVANWQENTVNFAGFFQMTASSHTAGNSWNVNIRPEVLADNLTVGSEIYNFAATSTGNNILVNPSNCQIGSAVTNIYNKLSGHPDINVSKNGTKISLTAKVAGESGNDIQLATSNNSALTLQPFAGGQNQIKSNKIEDKQDRPMNSVIQLNFNEAMNPLLVSGDASSVSPYLRVVNAASSTPAGGACSQDSDCASYQCASGHCVGNYLNGNFLIANGYKTVEFISDKECGQNGCGEKIYCLPANSHLAVELISADLKTCSTSADCLNFQPFSTCAPFSATRHTCQDENGKNYPVSDLNNLNGIVDAAMNSLDGNRDVFADGPKAFYNENDATNTPLAKDKYKWSFYINDQIMSEPPQISFVNPENNSLGADTKEPVQIKFNTLMMNSSLLTGSVVINNGQQEVTHHLINIFSASPSPLGYWVTADNRDESPLDGEPDTTVAFINHTAMAASVGYKPQVGSGVKDIYQNCYKPSAGSGCNATAVNPSCCFGTPTAVLGENGNCP